MQHACLAIGCASSLPPHIRLYARGHRCYSCKLAFACTGPASQDNGCPESPILLSTHGSSSSFHASQQNGRRRHSAALSSCAYSDGAIPNWPWPARPQRHYAEVRFASATHPNWQHLHSSTDAHYCTVPIKQHGYWLRPRTRLSVMSRPRTTAPQSFELTVGEGPAVPAAMGAWTAQLSVTSVQRSGSCQTLQASVP